jgi:hypothetical protein
VLFHQRTDSTERSLLVKAARRVSVMDTCRYLAGPCRGGPAKTDRKAFLSTLNKRRKPLGLRFRDCVFPKTVP